MSDGIIDPAGIYQFNGDLAKLETDVKDLKAEAKLFRESGAGVHNEFQGLRSCYKAPEAELLFATTAPVATKSASFADDLDKVASALSTYAHDVGPLAKKLRSLKDEAIAFVASVEGDKHWHRDQKKVDHNNRLMDDVSETVAAFQAAEIACHDKIVALVGGKALKLDDGSHQEGMYGYKADDLKHAEKLPWGEAAEREYTGVKWLYHQAKSFVWDGFIVDGVWGTVTGLGTLFGTEGWDKAGQAWTGLGKLATGLAISSTPLSGVFWATPDDKLPSWLRDSRTAMKETGKALIAYDQWGKNPARAAGGVTFNVLTTVFTGGSGAAAKGGAVAKTVSVLGKAGRIVDPMTYVGKAAKFGAIKVGDAFTGLKGLRAGTALNIGGDTFKTAEQAGTHFPKELSPETTVKLFDRDGKPAFLDKETGRLLDEHGDPLKGAGPIKKELSAEERATAPHGEAPSLHEPARQPALATAHAPGDGAAGRAGSHAPGGAADHRLGGSAHHGAGGPAHHAPGGSADHTPRGAAHEAPGGSAGHGPGGGAHEHGHGPSASHEPPGNPHDPARPPHDGQSGDTSHSAGGGHRDTPHPQGHQPDDLNNAHSEESSGHQGPAPSTGDTDLPQHGSEAGATQESKGTLAEKAGRAYEVYLQRKLEGGDSFREGGREFDGSYPGGKEDSTTWYEAKSGAYWDRLNRYEKEMLKFKSKLGDARRIAEQNGKEFFLISENPIPENIVMSRPLPPSLPLRRRRSMATIWRAGSPRRWTSC
ncbi:hypothetical protein AB0K09_18495, partial [Streptomyces sp. NPDC049577]|uniref:hypothetical protein n=1 Tax=Streptomyces sp. NPDC049577 TaxID=3155153 RepID=UPI00341C32E4